MALGLQPISETEVEELLPFSRGGGVAREVFDYLQAQSNRRAKIVVDNDELFQEAMRYVRSAQTGITQARLPYKMSVRSLKDKRTIILSLVER